MLAGAIRLDQYVLRSRAERLQSDIRSLELRKSTYADARRLEDRWFDKTKEKVRRPSWCDLEIFLNNTSAQHLEFFLNHPAVVAIYHLFGGRVAAAHSFIQVRDNVLWGKGINVGIETLETRSDGRRVQYDLEGSIATDPILFVRLEIPNTRSLVRAHARAARRAGAISLPLPTRETFLVSPTSTSHALRAGANALNKRIFSHRMERTTG